MSTILIVDDKKDERQVIEYLLNKYEIALDILQAENGLEGLRTLKEHQVDILFTDIQMPYMDGLTLAKEARTIYPDMEIIFFSGYDDFDYIKEALSLKAVNYILKPVNPEEFRSSMQEIMKNISMHENPYIQYEKALSEKFHADLKAMDKNGEVSDSVSSAEDSKLLQTISDNIRLKEVDELEKNVRYLLTKYTKASDVSHIYIRYIFTSLLRMLAACNPDLTEKDFQQIAEKIYTFTHLSELQELTEQHLQQAVKQFRQEKDSPNYAVYVIMQYIDEHYMEDLDLNQLADIVFLSPKYLSNIFVNVTGSTMSKYIRSIRLRKAQQLLTSTNRKITDICASVGYSNVSYFCKLFVEEYGMTPEKYRNRKFETKR